MLGLAEFYANKKVASFGDGRGHYKEAIDKTGKVTSYDGKNFEVDGRHIQWGKYVFDPLVNYENWLLQENNIEIQWEHVCPCSQGSLSNLVVLHNRLILSCEY